MEALTVSFYLIGNDGIPKSIKTTEIAWTSHDLHIAVLCKPGTEVRIKYVQKH